MTEREQMIIAFGNAFEKLILDMGGEHYTAAIVKAEWFRGLLADPEQAVE